MDTNRAANKKTISLENLKNIDYQVKTSELVKEALFLRQYGNKELLDKSKNSYEIEK